MTGLIGKKLGMTQVFAEDGTVVPVTVLEVGPCLVTTVRTRDRDGYEAVQLGYGELGEDRAAKPYVGQFKKTGTKVKKHLVEFRVDSTEGVEVGSEVKADAFEKGQKADVVSMSKGKGFTGVVKRWGFGGGPGGHGSHFHRAPGSIGMAATPSRVIKGMRMAGQKGNTRVTAKNLEVIDVDVEKNLILLKGSVPGARNGLVVIREAAGTGHGGSK